MLVRADGTGVRAGRHVQWRRVRRRRRRVRRQRWRVRRRRRRRQIRRLRHVLQRRLLLLHVLRRQVDDRRQRLRGGYHERGTGDHGRRRRRPVQRLPVDAVRRLSAARVVPVPVAVLALLPDRVCLHRRVVEPSAVRLALAVPEPMCDLCGFLNCKALRLWKKTDTVSPFNNTMKSKRAKMSVWPSLRLRVNLSDLRVNDVKVFL